MRDASQCFCKLECGFEDELLLWFVLAKVVEFVCFEVVTFKGIEVTKAFDDHMAFLSGGLAGRA